MGLKLLHLGPLEWHYRCTKFHENLQNGSKLISGGHTYRRTDTYRETDIHTHTHIYIYIYIYIQTHLMKMYQAVQKLLMGDTQTERHTQTDW
jgi:hypothetical protein